MSTWIKESQRTTDWYIFNKLYMCMVKNIDSMSVDYIRMFGHPASGDDQSDRETANELVIRMLSIEQMAEYYKNGVTVQIVNPKDTKDIYERISAHLLAWKEMMRTSFNNRAAPVDDLLLLDKLATVVYSHAGPLLTTTDVQSLLARRTGGVMSISRENIMKPLNDVGEVETKKVVPERVSMAEAFGMSSRPYDDDPTRWR